MMSAGVCTILDMAQFRSGPRAKRYPGPSGRHDALMLSLAKFSARCCTTAPTEAASIGLKPVLTCDVLVHRPERSGLPSGARGAGAVRFGLPSAARGIPAVGWFNHC